MTEQIKPLEYTPNPSIISLIRIIAEIDLDVQQENQSLNCACGELVEDCAFPNCDYYSKL